MIAIVSRSTILRAMASLCVPILLVANLSGAETSPEGALRADDELEEELRYLQAETYVITPSRIPQRIEKAPGTIYVVTDRQIRQMGARNLTEVIETVPGWHAWSSYLGHSQFTVRGTMGATSSGTLFMVNGNIVNEPISGSGVFGLPLLELDNVKRIEFVNGGISSVYGANAFAGVINVITKEGGDIDGLQMTARGGTYDTWETNVLYGKKFEKLEIAAYLDYFDTEGFEGYIERDMQTLSDNRYGTKASSAPGYMKGGKDQWHAQLTAKYQGLRFDGTYIRGEKEAPFNSWYPILDDVSTELREDYYLTLSYEFSPMDGLDLLTKVYRNQYRWEAEGQPFPKGALILTPGVPPGWAVLSDALVIFSEWEYSRTGLEVQSSYEVTDSNTVIAGVVYEEIVQEPTRQKGNYFPSPPGFILLPSVQDFPDQYKYPETKRDFIAFYAEDIWDMTRDLRLTVGGRYDHYSDFGGEFSPRAGLNWEFVKDYHAKLLYSRSFRAPSFNEFYNMYVGNRDLEPETAENWSLTLGGRFSRSFSADVSFFYREGEGLIVQVPAGQTWLTVNSGKMWGRGLELEMKYDFGRGTYLSMNYCYRTGEIRDPELKYWWTPQHVGTLMGNVRLTRHLNLNSYLLYRADWTRNIGDPRDDPPDYTLVNATLIAGKFGGWLKGLEFRGSVYNVFDEEYRSPQPVTWLPDDLPMPGRTYMVEARYTF